MATESETPTEYVPTTRISGTQDTALLRKRIGELVSEAGGYRVVLAEVNSYLQDETLTPEERIEKAVKKATKELRAWQK